MRIANGGVVADHFRHHEIEEFLRKIGIELGVLRQFAQARDLGLLPRLVGRRQIVQRFILADRLGAFEALGQQVNKRRIQIVDTVSEAQKLGIGHVANLCRSMPLFAAGAVPSLRRSRGLSPTR